MQSALQSRPTFLQNAGDLLRLAGPLMLGQLAVFGMTVTDIYMAGQVSTETLAALQLGGSIWAMINLLVIGMLLFAGSIYALTAGAPRWFGMVAPLGGLSLMAGWLVFFVGVRKLP